MAQDPLLTVLLFPQTPLGRPCGNGTGLRLFRNITSRPGSLFSPEPPVLPGRRVQALVGTGLRRFFSPSLSSPPAYNRVRRVEKGRGGRKPLTTALSF